MYTGQLFFRKTQELSVDGRRMMMVVGIVAIDDDDTIMDEMRCDVVGETIDDHVALTVFTPGEDMAEDPTISLATAGSLLLKPIWHV